MEETASAVSFVVYNVIKSKNIPLLEKLYL